MSKKKLLTLAKELDFTAEWQYYQYIIDSWYNGQKTQALKLYNQMKKEDRKEFLNSIDETMTTNSNELKDYIIDTLV